MADLQRTLGAIIRRERLERGLTLRELAALAALSLVYLGEIERGKKYPSASVLESIAVALKLKLPDLLEMLAEAIRDASESGPVTAAGSRIVHPAGTMPRDLQLLAA